MLCPSTEGAPDLFRGEEFSRSFPSLIEKWFQERHIGSKNARNSHPPSGLRGDFILKSVYDQKSGSIKINTHLHYICHRKAASGKTKSNKWTYRVFNMNTSRDKILGPVPKKTWRGYP
jgi:hypothetical protein